MVRSKSIPLWCWEQDSIYLARRVVQRVVPHPKMGPMSKTRRIKPILPSDDPLLAARQRKPVPHEFVLDALVELSPRTNPMFGCLAVYVEDKIVLILRDKREPTADNGVWLATTEEHHASLRREFPNMRSIQVLGKKVTGWQVLPADALDFEESAMRACELVIAGDARIGKIPKSRRSPEARPNGAMRSPTRPKAMKSGTKSRAKR
jgi:hypothetical protein